MAYQRKTSEEIAAAIHSDTSPVGIDAKKTHVLILEMLGELLEKVDQLEKEIAELKTKG